MGLKRVDLEVESPGIFAAGGAFRATLVLETESKTRHGPVSVESLSLRVVGRGGGLEEVFSSSPDLSWHLGEVRELGPGTTTSVAVSAALPPHLPPSSRLVVYSAALSVRLKGQPKPYTVPWTNFIVQGFLDLNSVPGAGEPVRLGGTGTATRNGPLPCCTRESGSFEVDLHLPRSGFCPGDFIRPIGTIQNNSRVRLNELRLFLEQRYASGGRGQSGRSGEGAGDGAPEGQASDGHVGVVSQDVVPIRLEPGHRRVIQGAALSVPFTPISPLDKSIAYSVRVQVDRHCDYRAPVLIGSEPIFDPD